MQELLCFFQKNSIDTYQKMQYNKNKAIHKKKGLPFYEVFIFFTGDSLAVF